MSAEREAEWRSMRLGLVGAVALVVLAVVMLHHGRLAGGGGGGGVRGGHRAGDGATGERETSGGQGRPIGNPVGVAPWPVSG